MAEIKLVIFDCDGVLMDSEIVAAKVEMEAYRQYGLDISEQEFAARFAGSSSDDIMRVLEKELELPLPASLITKIEQGIDERCENEAEMIVDADNVLDMFDQPRCICSNSPPQRLKSMLSRVGLYDRFRPYIFSAKDFDPPANKPKPDIFIKALSTFEVAAVNAVVVEDSVHGVGGALAAGIRAIGFTGASHSYPGHGDSLTDAGAETVVSRLRELPAVFEAMAEWDGLAG
ncbi:MAG: HAD family phosphatase [Rhizobiaceae bacterium]|nr:HAD family phosphatase [Rhizobiaceae bacterium]